MLKYITLLFVVFIGLFPIFLLAQNSRKNLENKRKELNKQIQNTSYLLSKTSKSKKQNLQQLATLQKQVQSREELIKLINEELDTINLLMEEKQNTIENNSAELERIKASYRKVLLLMFRYKSNYNLVHFLLSAHSFNKVYRKQYYLSKLEKKRSRQASEIKKLQRTLKLDINELEAEQADKAALLEEEMEQSGSLNKELEEKDKLVKTLKSKENQLKKDLNAKEKSKRDLNNKIENIIKEQIAASKSSSRSYKSKTPATKTTPSVKKEKYISVPDYSNSGGTFASKKGKLPSPVSNGAIISKFGKQRHPLFEEVFTYNNGIDIKTGASSSVKAVHQGTVVSVFAVPGNGNAVMLKHGNFYTTYSNLGSVNVNRGDEVKIGQILGKVGKDLTSGNYILHFELWNGKNKENPESWLK